MAEIRYLESRHDVIFFTGIPLWMNMKFGRLVHIDMPTAMIWSKSKPEGEFQYGRRFFKTGSSYISAVNWDMLTKFGMRIDFELRMRVTSSNTKPEVVLSHRCRHLEVVYDVIIPPRVARFGQKLVSWCGLALRLLKYGRSSNRKKNSNMADVCFSKPEVVVFRSCIKICRRNLVCR